MKQRQPDYFLILIILIIVFFGLAILFSASMVLSQDVLDHGYRFLKHQLIYGILPGLFFFFVLQRIHYRRWQKVAFPLMIFGLVLLGLVLVPGVGYSHGGARRWIGLGGFSLQPFEFVKLFFIIYLSALLSKKIGDERAIKESFVPFVVISGIVGLLVFYQPLDLIHKVVFCLNVGH